MKPRIVQLTAGHVLDDGYGYPVLYAVFDDFTLWKHTASDGWTQIDTPDLEAMTEHDERYITIQLENAGVDSLSGKYYDEDDGFNSRTYQLGGWKGNKQYVVEADTLHEAFAKLLVEVRTDV